MSLFSFVIALMLAAPGGATTTSTPGPDVAELTNQVQRYYDGAKDLHAKFEQQLTTAMGTNYKPSTGVTVTVQGVTATGWNATATHGSTTKICTLTLGGGSTNEGVPLCS